MRLAKEWLHRPKLDLWLVGWYGKDAKPTGQKATMGLQLQKLGRGGGGNPVQ